MSQTDLPIDTLPFVVNRHPECFPTYALTSAICPERPITRAPKCNTLIPSLPVPHNRTKRTTFRMSRRLARARLGLDGALQSIGPRGEVAPTLPTCRTPIPLRRPPARDTAQKARHVKTARQPAIDSSVTPLHAQVILEA